MTGRDGPRQAASKRRMIASCSAETSPGSPGKVEDRLFMNPSAFTPHPLQPLAEPLAQALDAAQGAAEPAADLRGGVALQAQLQYRDLVGPHRAEQLLDGLGEDGGLLRRRLAVRGQLPGLRLAVGGRHLPPDVTAPGAEVLDAVGAL